MELEKLISNSNQNATFIQISIPSGLTAQGIFLYLILEALRNLEGELTTDEGEILTTDEGEPLIFDNREHYPELDFFYWRDRLRQGNYEKQFVFIKREIDE